MRPKGMEDLAAFSVREVKTVTAKEEKKMSIPLPKDSESQSKKQSHPSELSDLFHKLISAGLPPCFARWTQSFFSDRRASMVYQNHKSRSFRVVVVGYPTPSEGWGHGGRPWSPRSRATSQGLDQRSYRDRKSPKSERRKQSVAEQCRMR